MRLSELQEDILKMATEQPNMTDEAIAGVLGCNEDWVAKTRRKHESDVSASDLSDTWQTVDDPFGGSSSAPSSESSSSSSGSSKSSSLTVRFLAGTIKYSIWLTVVAFKIAFWFAVLPLRVLDELLGGGNDN